MGLRLEGQAVGIAQAGGEEPVRAGGAVNFPDRGAVQFRRDAVLGDVAVGADAGIELGAVRAGGQALGPVMVDGAAGQRRQQMPGAVIWVCPS